MDKINFKNLPDKTTSITAEKLNKIQENVEKAINEKSSLPVGGDEGQILAKASNQDNDVEWIDNIGQGGGDTLPIGAILPFSGDIIPNGWLLCDGSVIEQEDYPELFEVLAGNYGIISREEIRLPDLRGKVTVGKDSSDTDFNELGKTGGGTAQENLRVSAVTYGSSESQIYRGQTLISKNRNETSGAVTIDNCDLDLMPPYIVTNYIIKAKMTVAIEGEIIQETGTASETNVYSAKAIDNKLKTSVKVEESGDGYTKYSDGTMICYGTVSITNPTHNDWYGFCRLTNEFTFNFAKVFKDNNYSLTISSTAFGYFSTIITSKTTNSFGFRACTHNQSAYTPKNGTFDYIAIGKWK